MKGKGFEDSRGQGSKGGNTLTNDTKGFIRGIEYGMRLIFFCIISTVAVFGFSLEPSTPRTLGP